MTLKEILETNFFFYETVFYGYLEKKIKFE